MKKIIVLLAILLFQFPAFGNEMTDNELLNKINEQIDNPNKKFDENLFFSSGNPAQAIKSRGDWIPGKLKKFFFGEEDAVYEKDWAFKYLNLCWGSWGDFIVYRLENDVPKIYYHHDNIHYCAFDVAEEAFFKEGKNLTYIDGGLGGTGHEQHIKHVLYLLETYDEGNVENSIKSFNFQIYDMTAFSINGRADEEWAKTLTEEEKKLIRDWGSRVITTTYFYDTQEGEDILNFVSEVKVDLPFPDVISKAIKNFYNYQGPYEVLVKQIVIGDKFYPKGVNGPIEVFNVLYECQEKEKSFPFYTSLVDCISKEPQLPKWETKVSYDLAKVFADVFKDLIFDDFGEYLKYIYPYSGDNLGYKINFNYMPIDLNNNGTDELIVEFRGGMFCDYNDKCQNYIITQDSLDENRWSIIGNIFSHNGFYIMDEQSNGFSVIKTRNYGNQVQRCEYVGTHIWDQAKAYVCK